MRGLMVYFAKVLRVMRPMPLVAPMKIATRREGRAVEVRALEVWIVVRETIVACCSVMLKDGILVGRDVVGSRYICKALPVEVLPED